MRHPSPSEYSPLRDALLALHKELLEYEKKAYEAFFGRIPNANTYFSLVMNHASFQWLRTLSELVVVFDELMSDPKTFKPEREKELLPYTKKLLTPDENGSDFARKYFTAIHSEPTIAVAHGHVVQELKKFE